MIIGVPHGEYPLINKSSSKYRPNRVILFMVFNLMLLVFNFLLLVFTRCFSVRPIHEVLS